MNEIALAITLVALVWCDVLTTFLFFRKARDYGYPKWSNEETSPMYRYFIKSFGLHGGMLAAALANPVSLLLLAKLAAIILSPFLGMDGGLGLGYGIFIGMLFLSVNRNYFVYYKCPASRYNEKILGKPVRAHKKR